MSKCCYGLMLKFPEPGKVKTRLARSVGETEAALLYQEIAEQVVDETAPRRGDYHRVVFFTPGSSKGRFAAWLFGETLMPQRGRGLGKRMLNVIEDLFAIGADRAVITGGDILKLDRAIISRAFRLLDAHDIVIGPAVDGGYYLIGMKKPYPRLFARMPWGTSRVFRMTIAAVERFGLTYALLPKRADVDRAGDLRKRMGRLPGSCGR